MGSLTALPPLRLGRVDFINTFPLTWALERHLPAGLAEEVAGVPTALNRMLAEGAIDVGNVSSIEYARHADEWVLLPSVCIGSAGAVESVHLVTDVPLPAVRSVSVTAKSASSVALVAALFPRIELRPEGAAADARLLIGDEALRSALDDPTPHHDLGQLFHERTGLPMVFAVWAARADDPRLADLDRALNAAVAEASEHSADVARAAAARFGFPAGYIARYFEKLRYRFGPREQEGLGRFYALAREAGVIDAVPELRFTRSTPTASTPTHAETL